MTGQGAAIVGAADHTSSAVPHATSGALTGQGSAIVGTANRLTQFDTSGNLGGNISIVNGVATRISTYPDPANVLAGIQYGPGFSLTGTLILPPSETAVGLRSFTGRF